MSDAKRYRVYRWWGDAEGWRFYRRGVKLWTVRRVLRRLYRRGWDNLSVLVECENA